MNKTSLLLAFILLFNTFLPLAHAQEEKDLPSIGDILGNILEGDNSYKAYQNIAQNEKSVCIDSNKNILDSNVDKNAFYQGWSLNCLVVNNSQLCEGIRDEDKLICNEPAKQPWYSNVWEKTKACGAGIKKSWEDYFKFMKDIAYYIINKDIDVKDEKGNTKTVGARTHANQQISQAWTSMKTYLATEMTKYQDKYHVSKTKAFFAITNQMLSKFAKGLNTLIAKAAPKVGCYNYKAKTRVICQVLAEFFAEPIIMFKFLKMGPKALKGTRVAKFFNYHKANAVRKVAKVADEAKATLKIAKVKPSRKALDFISDDSKVAIKIMENPKLHDSVVTHKNVFQEIFPDKRALDELDLYLSSTSKQEADDLAEVLRILKEDKAKMSPAEYKEFIEDVRKGIKKSCEI